MSRTILAGCLLCIPGVGFLEICRGRCNRRSTILTSRAPVTSWHRQIGDPNVPDSILDRFVHNADGACARVLRKLPASSPAR
jgi:hypothetical protein